MTLIDAMKAMFESHRLQFEDECPSLPAKRQHGFPHIVNLRKYRVDETSTDDLTCADGVATFLWNWDRELFRRFFDLTEKTIKLHYHSPDGIVKDMFISREEEVVTVGFRVDAPGVVQWDPKVVFTIRKSGSWMAKSWDSLGRRDTDREYTEDLGRIITTSMLAHELWNKESWPNATVTVAN